MKNKICRTVFISIFPLLISCGSNPLIDKENKERLTMSEIYRAQFSDFQVHSKERIPNPIVQLYICCKNKPKKEGPEIYYKTSFYLYENNRINLSEETY